jgi:hypothetical protein
LHGFARKLEFGKNPDEALEQLKRLLVELEQQGARSSSDGVADKIEAWLESKTERNAAVSLAHRLVKVTPPELMAILEEAGEKVVAEFTDLLREDDLASALEPFFTPELQTEYEIGDDIDKDDEGHKSKNKLRREYKVSERRFSFFEREGILNTEKTLNDQQRRDWESFKSFVVHVFARLDRMKRLDHDALLGFYVQRRVLPTLWERFCGLDNETAPLDKEALFSPAQWRNLSDDLHRVSTYPISPRGLIGLLSKYLQLAPDRIGWNLTENQLLLTLGRRWSPEDKQRLQWIDYLFRPLNMEVQYVWEQRILILDRSGNCELDANNILA